VDLREIQSISQSRPMGGTRGFAPHFKIARGPILKLNDYRSCLYFAKKCDMIKKVI